MTSFTEGDFRVRIDGDRVDIRRWIGKTDDDLTEHLNLPVEELLVLAARVERVAPRPAHHLARARRHLAALREIRL